MATSCVSRRSFKGPRALQPFHILQVDDNQTATVVIPQHIMPLTVGMDNSVRSEHGQSFVAFFVKEVRIPIMDDMLKPRS
jgi:glutaredoxin 2